MLIIGDPRIRDAALHSESSRMAGASHSPLCDAPDTFLKQISGRFALLWIDLAKGSWVSHPTASTPMASATHRRVSPEFRRPGQRGTCAQPRARQAGNLRLPVLPRNSSPGTIFENILRLEPGSRLVADRRHVDASPWWRAHFEEPADADFEACASNFRQLIKNAVERDLDGSRVGAFLSGGTDSSTVVGMLSQSGSPVTAYSIGFEAEGYDEMEFARIAAKHFGVKHQPYYITSDDLANHIPAVAASYDQPFGNSSVLPAYMCAKLAHDDGLTRMFAGDGGDELFGGNSRYAKQRIFGLYEKVPGLIKGALLEPALMQTPLGNCR
jgi:asparagine synthetase B (glutamine-hydrolysing)